jgi:hypothetical protein
MDATAVVDALCDCRALQARYFETRVGTHLHARFKPASGLVLWVFRFLDFGMVHAVKGRALVSVRGPTVCVNNRKVNSILEATDRAFKGRLARYTSRLYARMA